MTETDDKKNSSPKAQPVKLALAVVFFCIAGTLFYLGNAYREDLSHWWSGVDLSHTRFNHKESGHEVVIERFRDGNEANASYTIHLMNQGEKLKAHGIVLTGPANVPVEWKADWTYPEVTLYLNGKPYADGIIEEGRQIWIRHYGKPEGFEEYTTIEPEEPAP